LEVSVVVVVPVVVLGLVVVLSVVVVLVCANAKGAMSAQAILTMVCFICVLPLVNLLGASIAVRPLQFGLQTAPEYSTRLR
jgi:hypothetical protein